MASDDVLTLLDHESTLRQERTNFENWWQQIAYRVRPAEAQFTTITEQGEKRTERLFHSGAAIANDRFAAVLEDLLTPRSQVWHDLKPEDEEIAEDSEVARYLERLNKLAWSVRYRPKANYAGQKAMSYLDVGAFGNAAMFIDEDVGTGPTYMHVPLREMTWAHDASGNIDIAYRKFTLQARQAAQYARTKGWQLPEKIAKAATEKPFQKFEFLHCTRPNDDRVAGRIDHRGMPFASYIVACDAKQMVKTGGYTSWPWAISRYMLAGGETYARSPAMAAWPAILTLNEEKKTILRVGQRAVEPPILLSEDGALEPFNLQNGALNPGLVSEDGRPLAIPFQTGGDIPLGLELMALEQQSIDDSFLVSIFKVLAENPQMTATQVLEIAQEKATLLAPVMGRIQSEDLGKQLDREIDILAKQSQYAWIEQEMPDALREFGGRYKVEYRSSLSRAMRAQEGVAILRTFEAAPSAISLDPDAALVLDVTQAYRELATINGVPAKLMRDAKTVAALKAQKAEAAQASQIAAVAPEISQAMLNASKAEALRQGA